VLDFVRVNLGELAKRCPYQGHKILKRIPFVHNSYFFKIFLETVVPLSIINNLYNPGLRPAMFN